MDHATLGRVRALPHKDSALSPKTGLPTGTIILTLDGALPVEYLCAGDLVITRAGARVLRDLTPCRSGDFRLEFDQPEVIYADGQQLCSDSCQPH